VFEVFLNKLLGGGEVRVFCKYSTHVSSTWINNIEVISMERNGWKKIGSTFSYLIMTHEK